jgi:hypothetical protein
MPLVDASALDAGNGAGVRASVSRPINTLAMIAQQAVNALLNGQGAVRIGEHDNVPSCSGLCGVVSDDGQHGDADEQRQHGEGV